MKLHRLFGASALASAALLPHAAFAQVAEPSTRPADCAVGDLRVECQTPADNTVAGETPETSSETIVVTGSRIARPNIDTSIPITTISAQQVENVGQVSLGETLNRLPALRSTLSQANSTANIGTAGINALDLRGLGTSRTLVLVNGRRHVSGNPGTFAVDTNTIPNALLDRIDTVTGGNSGVYGSDAVSGVVNFVLKQDYEGFDGRLQGGVSDRGDRGSYIVSGLWGKNFSEGRGNIAVSAEYAYSETLLFNDRNSQTGAYTGVPGFYQTQRTTFVNPDGTARNEPPAGDGVPDTTFFPGNPGSKFGIISLGGTVITACPVATATNAARRAAVCTGQLTPTNLRINSNYVFLPNGTLVRDTPDIDLRSTGGGVLGGLTASGVEGAMLLPGLDRVNVNLIGHYDFSDAFKPYVEAKYVRVTANQTSTQPTFVNGRLTPTFYLDNPYLSEQARSTIRLVNGYAANNTTGAFNFFRFNNDIGTRAEQHQRETYRAVVGARGTLLDTGNWNYDAFFNYGRTETYYETGGNVDIRKFNAAADAARDPVTGQIVCRINIDANPNNNDPSCRPINLFGENAPKTTPDGINYVLVTSSRKQWAEQINAAYSISGDTSGFFRLPGGPIGIAMGVEYRREDYFSAYDPFTKGEYLPSQSNTFLNAIQDSNPDAVSVTEAFGEIRIPLLAGRPFFEELTIEGSGRVSKYNFLDDAVYAYTIGAIYSPIRDVRLRATFAQATRAPNLAELYAGTSQTFANSFTDPCSQTVINQDPNRVRNCAAAGIPTTITLPDGQTVPWTNAPTSGILGTNGGNVNLQPEVSKSFTAGAVFTPTFLPGFSLSVDYYNIRIREAIDTITPQALVNRCYDDPVGINNPFCALVNRRRTPGDNIADFTFAGQQGRRFAGFPDFNIGITGNGFVNQPFNYAKLTTSGIDATVNYRHSFTDEIRLNLQGNVSWLETRRQYTFLTDPDRYTRVNNTLGDPEWRALVSANFIAGPFSIALTSQYIGPQTLGAWNLQNYEQDRPPTNADAFPFIYLPEVFIHDIQFGIRVNENYRFFLGVDNVNDQLPPYGLTGTGTGSAIFPVTGRYFYAGARVNF